MNHRVHVSRPELGAAQEPELGQSMAAQSRQINKTQTQLIDQMAFLELFFVWIALRRIDRNVDSAPRRSRRSRGAAAAFTVIRWVYASSFHSSRACRAPEGAQTARVAEQSAEFSSCSDWALRRRLRKYRHCDGLGLNLR